MVSKNTLFEMYLNHITALTGQSVLHRLDTLNPEVVESCRSLLPHGGQIPGLPAFNVQVTQNVFTILRGREIPVVTCGVGNGRNDMDCWEAVIDLQKQFYPDRKITNPPKGRWLVVAILPGIALTAKTDIDWLADFERCMAAAIIKSTTKNK